MIFVFSATRHLFETTIMWEVKLLAQKHKVVILSEYADIPSVDGVTSIPFYRPEKLQHKPRLVRSLYSLRYYKKMADDLIEAYPLDTIITHQDSEFYTRYFLQRIKKKVNSRVVLRRPSVVIEPQKDFVWQAQLYSNNIPLSKINFLFSKCYFDIFLSLVATGKVSISRGSFLPTMTRMWENRKHRIYDVSLCYSERCKEYLSTIYEDSHVIGNQLLNDYLCDHEDHHEAVLFIASNDIEAVMTSNDCTRELAKKIVNRRISEVAKVFLSSGKGFHIRCKKGAFNFIEFNDELKEKVRFVDSDINLYEQLKEYECAAGFVTTALWLLAINSARNNIYSFQLLDTDFYNYYRDFTGVEFVSYGENGYCINENSTSSPLIIAHYSSILEYV